jgi:hypothetical protein
MTAKLIAVLNCTLAHGSTSPISGGVFTVTSTPSVKVLAENKGVYKTPLTYTFAGGNATGFVPGSIATLVPQTIVATATKVLVDGVLVMRVDDLGTMTAQGKTLPDPPGAVGPISGPVEISVAGQTKVLAE